MCDCQVTVHNEPKRGKNPFWQDNTLFASKAKINVFEIGLTIKTFKMIN